MTGIPPAAEASKASATSFASAALASDRPCLAKSALLAVTTCLPDAIAVSTVAFAAPFAPPMSSTTQSTSFEPASSIGSSNHA
jgi:hypothetical protein